MFSRRTNWSRERQPLSSVLAHQRSAGSAVIDLTISNPTRCGFALDERLFSQMLADPRGRFYNPDPRGILPAREAIANYYLTRGERVDAGQILLTTGTTESYGYLFRLLAEPGDEMLVPAPSYPLFEFIARIHDVVLKPYRLMYDAGWRVDLESVDAAWGPRTRAVLAVQPNNPTGSYIDSEERKFIQSRCRTHDAALIVDEVFHDFPWSDEIEQPGEFATEAPCLTFVLNGLSKVAASPQLKLGWLVIAGPSDLSAEAQRRLEILADTYLSVSTPIQLAAEALLHGAGEIQQQLLTRIRANLASLDESLRGSALTRLEGQGGWYAVLRIPDVGGDEELAIELLQATGVHVHPGNLFGFNSGAHWVVSLIGAPAEFGDGLARIANFWRSRS